MNKIRLHSVPAPADGRQTPLFALRCNYDYSGKYALHERAVERAALSALFFADRIALLPRSRNGVRIAETLAPLLGLSPDPPRPARSGSRWIPTRRWPSGCNSCWICRPASTRTRASACTASSAMNCSTPSWDSTPACWAYSMCPSG